MPRQVHREAAFLGLADEHADTIVAIPAGWMVERITYRVSFATDNFDNATFRNWRFARVAWALWFGPSTAAALSWSTDRQDSNYVHWQASPWIPDYETVGGTGGIPATPANAYIAGLLHEPISLDVYRTASGQEYQVRHVDIDSELSSFPTYSYASETVLDLWHP